MEYMNPIVMPLDLNVSIEPNSDPLDANRSNPFACLLDKLQYLTNTTCPDIFFMVNRLALYTSLAYFRML